MATKKEILEEVLTQSFDLQRYMKFIREFFNSLEMRRNCTEKMKSATQFVYTIDSYYHLARYTDSQKNQIAILAVKLKSGRSVERRRSVQRNFVSKIISESGCAAAIVAFYSEKDTRWRLSLVRLDQTWDAGKFKTTITPAKRFSYLVGENEPCRTAKERLLPIFEDEDFNPTLDKIEEAFSVDVVTDEFFKEYKNLYLGLKNHLEQNREFAKIAKENQFTSEQFAKKLMGQLVFLYFLQKKGWLGIEGLPRRLNTKYYQNAYYKKHHKRVKKIVERIYKEVKEDEYRLDTTLLMSENFSNEDAQILAQCFENPKWGTGKKMFIRYLFDYCKQQNKNFFNDFLQPLFYEALCTDRGGYQYYKRFNCKIPFLNGGLFDPIENYDWKTTSFGIPNELFSNRDEKGEYISDGILDIFERYNFTINEDEPLEREVAIDPEMLGKIFEDLLNDTDRKSKGAFYTPREIVHYMCQESLIQYLINETQIPLDDMKKFVLYGEIMKDEDMYNTNPNKKCLPNTVFEKLNAIETALKNIRMVDPAVGSGAFLLGMLSEIVKIRNNIIAYYANKISSIQTELRARLYEMNDPYNLKSETIKNCIHAVDIEPSAVDIAKLRLWLSLVIDDDLEPTFFEKKYANTPQRDPHPLPNLDYNIMCGNSLVEEFDGIKLFDDSILHDTADRSTQRLLFQNTTRDLLEELFKLQEKFFSENESEDKRKLKTEIDNYIDKIIRTKLEQDGNDANLKKYEKSIKTKVKTYFLWKLEFAKVFKEKDGFDVVIGNPPYLLEGKVPQSIFEHIPYYQGKMDIWYSFACVGIDFLKTSGILAFIATNKWFTNFGASIMRNKILMETVIKNIVDFGSYMIFKNANIQTMILILQKQAQDSYTFDYRKLEANPSTQNVQKLLAGEKEAGLQYLTPSVNSGKLLNKFILFEGDSIATLLHKIQDKQNFILTNKEVANGIHSHYDFVDGQGIFGLTESEKCFLSLTESEKKLLKPYYNSSEQLGRYWGDKNNKLWIIYTTSDFKNPRSLDNYPNIKKHLDAFRDVISSCNKPYGLHRSREERLFVGEKIVALRKSPLRPVFTYTNFDCYVSAAFYVIKTERINQKFLTALFNSKLIAFWLKYRGKMQGNNYQLDKEPLLQIPIYNPKEDQQQPIIFIVDYILFLKQMHNDSIVLTFYEYIIDACIYEFYFPEEIHAADKGVIGHLQDLPPINDTMSDEQKLAIINNEFVRLYDPYHPVRNKVETIQNVEVIRIMKGVPIK
jgi:adenine-specific DNA-methyltransferase